MDAKHERWRRKKEIRVQAFEKIAENSVDEPADNWTSLQDGWNGKWTAK